MSFDLIDEPWVLADDRGEVREVSLREAFERAHQLRRLAGEVTTQEAAMLRLLVAILYRALPVDGDEEDVAERWEQWWCAETLPSAVVDYLTARRDRLDLFDDAQPFLQVGGLQAATTSGLMTLVADVPPKAGFFTTRAAEELHRLSAAEAARWLVHCHAFDPSGIKTGAVGDPRVKGGKGYPIGTGWAGNLGLILVEGDTLKDTLLLNLVLSMPSGESDHPVWERAPLSASVAQDHPYPQGPADALTWPSRRIRLIGDRDGVTDVIRSNGDPLHPRNQHNVEPHTGWRRSENQEKLHGAPAYMPRTHAVERGLWRGLPTLLPVHGASSRGSDSEPWLAPAVLGWVARLKELGALPDAMPIRLRAVGMEYGTQSSVVTAMIDDRLRVRADLLSDPRLKRAVNDAVDIAEKVALAIGDLARNLERACGRDGEAARTRALEQAYHRLGSAFARSVEGLTSASATDAWAQHWHSQLGAVARDFERELVAAVADAAFVGRDIEVKSKGKPTRNVRLDTGLAVQWFRHRLGTLVPLSPDKGRSSDPAIEQEGQIS